MLRELHVLGLLDYVRISSVPGAGGEADFQDEGEGVSRSSSSLMKEMEESDFGDKSRSMKACWLSVVFM